MKKRDLESALKLMPEYEFIELMRNVFESRSSRNSSRQNRRLFLGVAYHESEKWDVLAVGYEDKEHYEKPPEARNAEVPMVLLEDGEFDGSFLCQNGTCGAGHSPVDIVGCRKHSVCPICATLLDLT